MDNKDGAAKREIREKTGPAKMKLGLEQDAGITLAEELNPNDRTLEAASCGGTEGSLPWETGSAREMQPEEWLAAAVVLQAAEDWRQAAGMLRRRPRNSAAAQLKRDAEMFFRSRWFRLLADLEGEEMLKRLKEENDALLSEEKDRSEKNASDRPDSADE